MNDAAPRHPMTQLRVVHRLPGMDAVTVRRDIEYRTEGDRSLGFDLYSPTDSQRALAPAVLIVNGYPDPGFKRRMGCAQKEMSSCEDWARLIAASGLIAVTYENHAPIVDARAILSHLQTHGSALGIDPTRLGLWACSGHGPTALSLLMNGPRADLRCAALLYPYLLDEPGFDGVAAASRAFGFAVPDGNAMDQLSPRTALFIARAGRDECTDLNPTLDRFIAASLARNVPVTLTNHSTGPHAFDVMEASQESVDVIEQVLNFLRRALMRS